VTVKLNLVSSTHSNINNLSSMLENSRTCLTENIKQTTIMGNYTKYRYYKGENENPFDGSIDSPSFILWQARCFLTLLISKRIFCSLQLLYHRMGDQFMALLSEDDKEYLTEKNRIPVLELWLEYLYDTKYSGKRKWQYTLKKKYYSTTL
jgi:hypothetical protein